MIDFNNHVIYVDGKRIHSMVMVAKAYGAAIGVTATAMSKQFDSKGKIEISYRIHFQDATQKWKDIFLTAIDDHDLLNDLRNDLNKKFKPILDKHEELIEVIEDGEKVLRNLQVKCVIEHLVQEPERKPCANSTLIHSWGYARTSLLANPGIDDNAALKAVMGYSVPPELSWGGAKHLTAGKIWLDSEAGKMQLEFDSTHATEVILEQSKKLELFYKEIYSRSDRFIQDEVDELNTFFEVVIAINSNEDAICIYFTNLISGDINVNTKASAVTEYLKSVSRMTAILESALIKSGLTVGEDELSNVHVVFPEIFEESEFNELSNQILHYESDSINAQRGYTFFEVVDDFVNNIMGLRRYHH